MEKKQLQNYLRGWEEVAKADAAELRSTPLHLKLKQIVSLFQLGIGLGFTQQKKDEKADIEIAIIRARWSLLKASC